MKRFFVFFFAATISLASQAQSIIAHRGFWKCDAGGYSENSIASLKAAQDAGFWGSEFDLQLTSDNVVIVNHDPKINGDRIEDFPMSHFDSCLLPNGERRPTLDEYLNQAEKCISTRLVIELKKQKTPEREKELVEKTVTELKKHNLYDSSRIMFISFSWNICTTLVTECPGYYVYYLGRIPFGGPNPSVCAKAGLTGIDYIKYSYAINSSWIKKAHDLNMQVGCWTIDKMDDIVKMVSLGVDSITTNEPMLVRSVLADKEIVNK